MIDEGGHLVAVSVSEAKVCSSVADVLRSSRRMLGDLVVRRVGVGREVGVVGVEVPPLSLEEDICPGRRGVVRVEGWVDG